jgi:hypothetical protein
LVGLLVEGNEKHTGEGERSGRGVMRIEGSEKEKGIGNEPRHGHRDPF